MTCRKFGGVILCGDDDSPPPHKPCSVCGRVLARYKDGTVRLHLDGTSWPPAHCAGSRLPPAVPEAAEEVEDVVEDRDL